VPSGEPEYAQIKPFAKGHGMDIDEQRRYATLIDQHSIEGISNDR